MLSGVALAVIVLYGGLQAIDGHITVGTVVAFVATLAYLFEPIQQLSQLYTTYQSGMAALEKIFQLLDVQPTSRTAPDATTLGAHPRRGALRGCLLRLPPARGAVERQGPPPAPPEPRRRWRSTTSTCASPPGQTVALVGATGAGKSTMAKLVARFYDPTAGRVLVDGHDLREVTQPLAALADGHRAAGGVPVLGHDRARTSPSAAPTPTSEEIRAAAARWARTSSSPSCRSGYDTEVGERGAQLSAGQRQLIAFARALIADPRILILDEATSNVDLHTEGRIEDGPAAPARGPHGDRDRPPPVDDPPGGAHRRARARPASSSRARTRS